MARAWLWHCHRLRQAEAKSDTFHQPPSEVHINRHKTTGAGRLVMRMRGVLKLLLNTPIFPTTRRAWLFSLSWAICSVSIVRYEKVGQKSVRFVGVDTEESQGCESEAWCDLLCPHLMSPHVTWISSSFGISFCPCAFPAPLIAIFHFPFLPFPVLLASLLNSFSSL